MWKVSFSRLFDFFKFCFLRFIWWNLTNNNDSVLKLCIYVSVCLPSPLYPPTPPQTNPHCCSLASASVSFHLYTVGQRRHCYWACVSTEILYKCPNKYLIPFPLMYPSGHLLQCNTLNLDLVNQSCWCRALKLNLEHVKSCSTCSPEAELTKGRRSGWARM